MNSKACQPYLPQSLLKAPLLTIFHVNNNCSVCIRNNIQNIICESKVTVTAISINIGQSIFALIPKIISIHFVLVSVVFECIWWSVSFLFSRCAGHV